MFKQLTLECVKKNVSMLTHKNHILTILIVQTQSTLLKTYVRIC